MASRPPKPAKPVDRPSSPRTKKKRGKVRKQTIRDLSRIDPADLNELEQIWDEFDRGPHRIAAILAAAFVENALEYAISHRFSQISNRRPEEFETLFRYPQFLSSFVAKIEIGYAIGIYGQLVRDDLDTIRIIRNQFAHARILIDFGTTEVADEVQKLKFINWMKQAGIIEDADKIDKKRAASDNPFRYDFVYVARALSHYIFTNFAPPFEPTTLP
jgi:hypothetical protein